MSNVSSRLKNTSALLVLPVLISGCLGDSKKDNEIIGQVKKVESVTPIICPDYNRVDISLGVMRNGVGSMSTQDLFLYVPNNSDFTTLQQAARTGALVNVVYNEARVRWCVEDKYITHIEIIK